MNDKEELTDEQMKTVLGVLNHSGAAPDRGFLSRLREKSTEAFLQTPDVVTPQSATTSRSNARREAFAAVGFRVGVLSIVALLLVAVAMLSTNESAPTLGEARTRSTTQQAVCLSFASGDRQQTVWIRDSRQLRIDDQDGSFRLVDGDRQWSLSPTETVLGQDAFPYRDQDGLDVLGFFNVADERVRKQIGRVHGRRNREGDSGNELVFQQTMQQGDGSTVQVYATADAGNLILRSLLLDVIGADGTRTSQSKLTLSLPAQDILEQKFAVARILGKDDRVGKVVDVQGMVSIKPVLHSRWTPVCRPLTLKPGDWLRTDLRGANAAAVQLGDHGKLILGPGTLLEVVTSARLRLLAGEIAIEPTTSAAVELVDPRGKVSQIKGLQMLRVDRQTEKLVRLESKPQWLQGFEGSTSNESIGSLVALVDGRNVPLTVGYHHVTVDIRDQIARTTIEESFVNHTDGRLEGTFYFPLPQDASISGFGMWIGNDLIEADVVEKQRAREIYETILREKRDPGLLEWTGGNIFKARVFPIEAHSEKRVKITYTQVLPKTGSSYRYCYALQSELLKQHPLRELNMDVKVNSVVPLSVVASPTHPAAKVRSTGSSAHVEFSAQEYTPQRDFEVEFTVAENQPSIVTIPHERGDDGYFMLMLTPPTESGAWQREVIEDGRPLDLLILADTSASMDDTHRRTQNELLTALLTSLSPQDTFDVATCDKDCRWIFDAATAATEENVKHARKAVRQRRSLGWTDLDTTFNAVVRRVQPGTHVVYIGDGIVTTRDADPVAFSKRLQDACHGVTDATFHAVAVSSSYEPTVLQAIAGMGGGSVRRISGSDTPQSVALALLAEMTQPSLRDLQLEFRGLQVARVYPRRLPNLPAGTQQIILGRYLPLGEDQVGDVIVTGRRGDETVRFSAPLRLANAEHGNSFIPRLWARMHLDELLEQGSSTSVKDEIIALSEEYHIITPYTSLLVLESDADRERFQVKRRFQMRDGERFFAAGRDNAKYELLQQQMRLASDWRLNLRRQVLYELVQLGRGSTNQPYGGGGYGGGGGGGGYGIGLAGAMVAPSSTPQNWSFVGGHGEIDSFATDLSLVVDHRHGVDGGLAHYSSHANLGLKSLELWNGQSRYLADGSELDMNGALSSADFEETEGLNFNGREAWPYGERADFTSFARNGKWSDRSIDRATSLGRRSVSTDSLFFDKSKIGGYYPANEFGSYGDYVNSRYDFDMRIVSGGFRDLGNHVTRKGNIDWLTNLIPDLSPAIRSPDIQVTWPAAAVNLSKSLLRVESLSSIQGGIQIVRTTEHFDAFHEIITGRDAQLQLYDQDRWLVRNDPHEGQSVLNWCEGGQRGVLGRGFGLGRARDATSGDLGVRNITLVDYSLSPLHEMYRSYDVRVVKLDDSHQQLLLSTKNNPTYVLRLTIDTTRHVLTEQATVVDGEVTSRIVFSDFVEFAGRSLATTIETRHSDGVTSRVSVTAKVLSEQGMNEQFETELATVDDALLLPKRLPTIAAAKTALADDGASIADFTTLMIYYSSSGQWERVDEYLNAAEEMKTAKPGLRWIRYAFLNVSRQRETLRKSLLTAARSLTQQESTSDLFLADWLVTQGHVLEANEQLQLLDTLRPVYRRQPEWRHALKSWTTRQSRLLSNAGQPDQALAALKRLIEEYAWDVALQIEYSNLLIRMGKRSEAQEFLDLRLTMRWRHSELESIRYHYVQMLQQQGRYDEIVMLLEPWLVNNPPSHSLYGWYLTALLHGGDEDKAYATVRRWLDEGRIEEKLPESVEQRVRAAIVFALGGGPHHHLQRIDPRWLQPLADTAWFFALHSYNDDLADQVSSWKISDSTEFRALHRKAWPALKDQISTLSSSQIVRLAGWVDQSDQRPSVDDWKELATALQGRWEQTADETRKTALGDALVNILRRVGTKEQIAFLRHRFQTEDDRRQRANHAHALFNTLLSLPWSDALETELYDLLDDLSYDTEPVLRSIDRATRVQDLVNHLLASRLTALNASIENPEELTRMELRERLLENQQSARRGLLESLTERFMGQIRDKSLGIEFQLQTWVALELSYLQIKLDDLEAARRTSNHLLDTTLPRLSNDPENDEHLAVRRRLRLQIIHRCLMTLAYLSARQSADPAIATDLLARVDQQILQQEVSYDWRGLKYKLLIAWDRPRELEAVLRRWIRSDDPVNRWRRSLGYLLAEQGHIEEPIRLFESIEADDELLPVDYRALAAWYIVQDQRDKHEQSLVKVFAAEPEWQLQNALSQSLRPWQQQDGPLPTELDANVLRMFTALFQKSSSPANYVYQLREYYQASRDFRLLAGVADAIVAHCAGQVYPFLQNINSVLSEIRDEATADELLSRIADLRARCESDVDQRALDLLEVQVERRAAEILNQPGPHVDAALTAMQRAFQRKWAPGERRQMADYLRNLGRIRQPRLAEEQQRELQELYASQEPGTLDRLVIGLRWAEAIWRYGSNDRSIEILQAALDEYLAGTKGILVSRANESFQQLINYLTIRGHGVRAEQLVLKHLEKPDNDSQRYFLIEQQFVLYGNAIRRMFEVSLGKEQQLFDRAEREARKALDTDDNSHRYRMLEYLLGIYRAASDANDAAQRRKESPVYHDIVPKLLAFKNTELQSLVLDKQTDNYSAIVRDVAAQIHDLVGPLAALQFLVEQIEREASWFRLANQDGWQQHGHELARWRVEAGDLGELDARLVRIVLRELRADLESRQHRNRQIYHRNYHNYWAEKEPMFAAAAREVYEQHKSNSPTIQYIADYVWYGLEGRDLAIDMLKDAYQRDVLDESAQSLLAQYLHWVDRAEEEIPVLERLVKEHPDAMSYRTRLMLAYFDTRRGKLLARLVENTDSHFHGHDLWSEGNVAKFAAMCVSVKFFKNAITYYDELIALRQRTAPRRGIGDGTLSQYYAQLAYAYQGIGDTAQAVDAASGAVVSWGHDDSNRRRALQSLTDVFRNAPDLDAYVARLDEEVATSKRDRPIVRKAIGLAYQEQMQFGQAIEQFKLAIELQPNDTETHRAMIACFDARGDRQGAIDQLFASLQLSRRDLALYQDLGQRLQAAGRLDEAERAFVSMVEMQPHESESHASLAALRETQDRWNDAIFHWQRVADLRALEPTGLVALAKAQLHEKQWTAARGTIQRLKSRPWPRRFQDIQAEINSLEAHLPTQP